MPLSCVECGAEDADELGLYRCRSCAGLLEVRAPLRWNPEGTGVWRYAGMLPSVDERVTLGEGGTPLLDLPALARWAGVAALAGKVEAQNPTGSFKDRGMTVGVSLAKARGVRALLCASTGNTSASLAAYSARAGLTCAVLVPKGKIARGKMAQALALGARVIEVDGTFDEALTAAESLATGGVLLMNSVNPFRLEGQKTLVFEILEAAGVPDVLAYPYGNGGNVSAGWKGLREAREVKAIARTPRLLAAEASDRAGTLASAIRIGRAVNAAKAERALRESDGVRVAVPDEEIVEAQRRLAAAGLFVEPASAAGVAGLRRAVAAGEIDPASRAVAVLTGSGLKDPDAVDRFGGKVIRARPDVESLRKVIFA